MDIISSLPPELSQYIFSYLSYRDLCLCSTVNKSWRELINVNQIWRRLCFKEGWKDTDMVDDFRTHKLPEQDKDMEETFWKCKWRTNYERNYRLPICWQKNKSWKYELKMDDVPAVSFDCNGIDLAVGHSNGTVNVYNVKNFPRFVCKIHCILPNYRVIKVLVTAGCVLAVQSMLIQFYKYNNNNYKFIGAKSLELGSHGIDGCDKMGLKACKKEFIRRYDEWVGGDKDRSNNIFINIFNNTAFLTAIDLSIIYGFHLNSCSRIETIHLNNTNCKIRYFIGRDNLFYLIYTLNGINHVKSYDLITKTWIFEVTTMNVKTRRIILGQTIVIGVGVCGPALIHNGMLTVWDKYGFIISTKPTPVCLPLNGVATSFDCVLYSVNTKIIIWHPYADVVLREISVDSNAVYLKANCFNCLTIFTHVNVYICNWLYGKILYKIRPFITNNGDYSNIFYDDKTMIITKNINNQVEIIAYC